MTAEDVDEVVAELMVEGFLVLDPVETRQLREGLAEWHELRGHNVSLERCMVMPCRRLWDLVR